MLRNSLFLIPWVSGLKYVPSTLCLSIEKMNWGGPSHGIKINHDREPSVFKSLNCQNSLQSHQRRRLQMSEILFYGKNQYKYLCDNIGNVWAYIFKIRYDKAITPFHFILVDNTITITFYHNQISPTNVFVRWKSSLIIYLCFNYTHSLYTSFKWYLI